MSECRISPSFQTTPASISSRLSHSPSSATISPSSTKSPLSPTSPTDPKNKNYVCSECGKVFSAHYNLTRHMPVHTGARPFVCKVSWMRCEIVFSSSRIRTQNNVRQTCSQISLVYELEILRFSQSQDSHLLTEYRIFTGL